MKNFLLSPASNAAVLGAALVFALLALLQGASGAAQDVTGLALSGGPTNFSAVSAQYITATSSMNASTLSSSYLTATTGLQAQSATVTGTLSGYSITATESVSTPLLYVEGVAQSGPVRFGSVAFAVTGTTIAHGLGTTPTVAIVTGAGLTDTFTNTIGVLSVNSTNIIVAIPGGATVTTLYWMAGR